MNWLLNLLKNNSSEKETDTELLEYKGVIKETLENLSNNKGDDE